MAVEGQIKRILQLYPDGCQAHAIESVKSDHSFSGAMLWRVTAPRGPLCLRRWPAEHPTPDRLQFIQAVLWHVDQEGFRRVPLPLETHHHHGFVRHAGHLWELTPWLAGTANYRQSPSPQKLHNAMVALVQFHEAAGTFPLPETGPIGSPGIAERTNRVQSLISGRLAEIHAAIAADAWPELVPRAERVVRLAETAAGRVLSMLKSVGRLDVALQPCIRDVWHPHVLFVGDEVSGIVDFGSMRPENVAADVARLLGSLSGDDPQAWKRGLDAYHSIKPLSADERSLVDAFDRSTVLLGGLQWLEWIYLEGRRFENRGDVLVRVDEFLDRLEKLTQAVC